jgi:acetyl/propionyl-CoA carboxylase alpha subunit
VSTRFDALLAKIVAHGADRPQALARLRAALDATEVGGVTPNLPLLRWLTAHPRVEAGAVSTAFLVECPPLSRPVPAAPEPWAARWRLNLPAPPPAPPPDPDPPPHLVAAGEGGQGDVVVSSPMPGTVVRVLVGEGDEVRPRQPLVVVEAMKMETPVVAPYPAVVRRVEVQAGDRVAAGAPLVHLAG